MNNDYLNKLLSLQQDGNQAISAPYNWVNQKPLLDVKTDIDNRMEVLSNKVLGYDGTKGVWYFLIGTPGNGKSSAVGKLTGMLSDTGCNIYDEEGTPIEELEPDKVPYMLNVYKPNSMYPTVKIIQDASVVRDPFNMEAEPAKELLNSLSDAWDKGVSVVVCTNRGVLEKAYWSYYKNSNYSSKDWFNCIKDIINSENDIELPKVLKFEAKKKVFNEASISFSQLDNKSLIIGSNVFEKLIEKAIQDKNWINCGNCEHNIICPFYNNKNWLKNKQGRESFIKFMGRAEVYSGQAIVLREAIACISFILAGCPNDYGEKHPCEWVKTKYEKEDYVALAMRRIYMALFASYTENGFESDIMLRKKQILSLSKLKDMLKNEQEEKLSIQLGNILSGKSPSRNVGLQRLLSDEGIFSKIDILNEPLNEEFINSWDSGLVIVQNNNSPLICELERRLHKFFENLEYFIENISDYQSNEINWALTRWSSFFIHHLGAMIHGKTAWDLELDEYIELLKLVNKRSDLLNEEEIIRINNFQKSIDSLINKINNPKSNEKVIKITDNVSIKGTWVEQTAVPTIQKDCNGLKIGMTYSNKNKGEQAYISAQIYIWLKHHDINLLDIMCFPQELLRGIIDARSRAVAKGKYAFSNDVELVIPGIGKKITRVGDVLDISNL